MKQYYVYIMASKSRRLYTGVTNDLQRRVFEHKRNVFDSFTAKYNINRLVYYESTDYVQSAIAREKQIKAWRRDKRVSLIESTNPTWMDLSHGWFDPESLREP